MSVMERENVSCKRRAVDEAEAPGIPLNSGASKKARANLSHVMLEESCDSPSSESRADSAISSPAALGLGKEEREKNAHSSPAEARDFLRLARQNEKRTAARNHQWGRHPELDPKVMRVPLVDWLFEVTMEFKLEMRTFHLGVALLDNFMGKARGVSVTRLQLVGIAALFVAAKMEEIEVISVTACIWITDDAYTKEDVLEMEIRILETLQWDVACVSLLGFVQARAPPGSPGLPEAVHTASAFIASLCLLDPVLLDDYSYDEIAEAIVTWVRLALHVDPLREVGPCVRRVEKVYKRSADCRIADHYVPLLESASL